MSLNDRSPTESVVLKHSWCSQTCNLLPLKNEAFGENAARAHVQVAIWRYALDADPPSLQPTSHGWEKDSSNSLMPTTVPEGTLLAPVQLLKLIKCSCESDMPCKTQRCGCSSANLACTVFCSCQGSKDISMLTPSKLKLNLMKMMMKMMMTNCIFFIEQVFQKFHLL